MRTKTIRKAIASLWTLALLLVAGTAVAQESRGVSIGNLSYSTDEAFTGDNILFPRDYRHTDDDVLHTYGITVGVRRAWTTPEGTNSPVQVAQAMQSKFTDFENVVVPVSGAFFRRFRNPYPDKVIDGTNWTPQFDQDDPDDPNIPSDALMYSRQQMWPNQGMGLELERWTYLLANDAYDEMVIHEYVLTNTSGEVREDVYLGLNAAPQSSAHYPADLWGNYYGATYRQYAAGDPNADSLRIYYNWRADQSSTPNEDDYGDPDSRYGYFREAQFVGHVVLHADASATDESDDPAQPWKAGWSQRDKVANLNEADQATTYEYLSQPWNNNRIDGAEYSIFLDGEGNVQPDSGPYRALIGTETGTTIPPDGIDLRQYNNEQEQEKNGLLSFGPYTLQPGEDVRIVTAFVAGMIPSRLAIDAGRAYDGGQAARNEVGVCPLYQPDQGLCRTMPAPLTYEDQSGFTRVQDGVVYAFDPTDPDGQGEVLAQPGDVLTQDQKDAIINIGQDLMFLTASRAVDLWKRSSVRSGQGAFDVDYTPAAPSIEGFSENDQIRLTWSDNSGSGDSRGSNITAWRVYRSYDSERPPALESPYDTTFVLQAELPVSQTEYVDTEVVRGQDYYYTVTAVNADGQESSWWQNRTGTGGDREREALTPTRAPDPGWQDNVVVVPNPYHVQAAQKYSGRRLNFLNLPPFANVHIYTMAGDLVQTLEHNANTGDIDWERQDTFSTMEIVSGVYIWVVEELDGPGGSPTGEQAIGKFVVVK